MDKWIIDPSFFSPSICHFYGPIGHSGSRLSKAAGVSSNFFQFLPASLFSMFWVYFGASLKHPEGGAQWATASVSSVKLCYKTKMRTYWMYRSEGRQGITLKLFFQKSPWILLTWFFFFFAINLGHHWEPTALNTATTTATTFPLQRIKQQFMKINVFFFSVNIAT